MEVTLKNASLFFLLHSALIFLMGIPPFDHMSHHFFTQYHPIARQLKVVRIVNAGSTLQAMNTAIELGIFEELRDGAYRSNVELAETLSLPVRGITPLLEKLASSDFLYVERSTGRYTNSATANYHLVSNRSDRHDMRGFVQLMADTPYSGTMTDSVRNGGSVLVNHAETDSNEWWTKFAAVTGSLANSAALTMVTKLETTIFNKHSSKQEMRVLDVASGSGAYGFAVIQHYPNSHVILNDYANVLEQTRQNALEREIDMSRLSFLEGSFLDVQVEVSQSPIAIATASLDVVLVPNLVHHFSNATTTHLLEQVYLTLRPGGHIILVEICRPEVPYAIWEGSSPPTRSFSLALLQWSKQGRAYSVQELMELTTKRWGLKMPSWLEHPFPSVRL